MLEPLLWGWCLSGLICLFIAGWSSDKMANELRDSGLPEFTDPYKVEMYKDWFGRVRFSSRLAKNHRAVFPASGLSKVQIGSGITSAILLISFLIFAVSNRS